MAKEISRTFDLKRGAVVVQIEDNFGNLGLHTIYAAGVESVEDEVAHRLTTTDAATDAIAAKFTAAGWKQNAG